jgi:hypothetical protein
MTAIACLKAAVSSPHGLNRKTLPHLLFHTVPLATQTALLFEVQREKKGSRSGLLTFA